MDEPPNTDIQDAIAAGTKDEVIVNLIMRHTGVDRLTAENILAREKDPANAVDLL